MWQEVGNSLHIILMIVLGTIGLLFPKVFGRLEGETAESKAKQRRLGSLGMLIAGLGMAVLTVLGI